MVRIRKKIYLWTINTHRLILKYLRRAPVRLVLGVCRQPPAPRPLPSLSLAPPPAQLSLRSEGNHMADLIAEFKQKNQIDTAMSLLWYTNCWVVTRKNPTNQLPYYYIGSIFLIYLHIILDLIFFLSRIKISSSHNVFSLNSLQLILFFSYLYR